ncbi:MAG: cobyric acid synthase, partial [Clostridia bacterium]|nr:cobyric acid synthase [Clostridia bacterium]
PAVLAAYESLAAENDIIVIEGAGSPAEINLRQDDFVNRGLAALVDAPVLLAGDIDRGGVFAQLYGTVALLEPSERERVKGLLINKFRGDVSLLGSGLAQLEALTGVPVLGVIPYLRLHLDEEDSLAPSLGQKAALRPVDVAVLRLPKISNFTDFAPLENHPVLGLRYVESADELGSPDLVILPGTKSTLADLLWLRQTGLEAAVQKLAARDVPVLGICGGFQMLGEELADPDGVEAETPSTVRGLGLLPLRTVFAKEKTRTRVQADVRFRSDTVSVDGYEIHNGTTEPTDGSGASPELLSSKGNVFGTYLHGLFDSGELTEALAKWLCERRGIAYEAIQPKTHDERQEEELTRLASAVREALDMDAVYRILKGN